MSEDKTRRSPSGKSAAMYELKITIPGLRVWRRLRVRGDVNLGLLHAVIQVAMGWTNSHLHQFTIGNKRYSDPRVNSDMSFGEPPDLDEGKTALMEVAPREKAKFIYEYDFGDSWVHYVTVEKIHSLIRRTRVLLNASTEVTPVHRKTAAASGGMGICLKS